MLHKSGLILDMANDSIGGVKLHNFDNKRYKFVNEYSSFEVNCALQPLDPRVASSTHSRDQIQQKR